MNEISYGDSFLNSLLIFCIGLFVLQNAKYYVCTHLHLKNFFFIPISYICSLKYLHFIIQAPVGTNSHAFQAF
jgi:hypothetical protein